MAHDESEDIEDLATAGDLIDGIDKMLAGLRHLLGDVGDHEKEEMGDQEAPSAGGTEVILPLSGPVPAMEQVFGKVREETSEDWLEENPTCTPQVAKKLLDQHSLGWFDFVADNPDQRSAQRVDSQKLLAWMGY